MSHLIPINPSTPVGKNNAPNTHISLNNYSLLQSKTSAKLKSNFNSSLTNHNNIINNFNSSTMPTIAKPGNISL